MMVCHEALSVIIVLTNINVELEPRRASDRRVDMFIDLGATFEDHNAVCLLDPAEETLT